MPAQDPNPFAELGKRTRVGLALERWLSADKWRATAEERLATTGLTFKQWLVLAAAEDGIRESGAVSQSDIARCTGLDAMTVSRAMRALDDAELANRDSTGGKYAYSVLVTPKGRRVLKRAFELLSASS
jgi:DNA-binding MarR family transcriptional regulator